MSKLTPRNNPQVQNANPARPVRASGVHAEYYSGLLPHPDHLERFEGLLPGATDRMLNMAEAQSQHRQRMERSFMRFNGWSQILGVVFAAVIVLGGIAAGTFLIYAGKSTEGLSAILTPLGLVAALFFVERRSQAKEKLRKEQATQR